MTRRQIKLGLIFIVLISMFTYVAIPAAQPLAQLATGYASKYVCSHVFVSNFGDEKAIEGIGIFPISKAKVIVDRRSQSVTSTLWGLGKRTAYFYKKGPICGCTLDRRMDLDVLPYLNRKAEPDTMSWPYGSQVIQNMPNSDEIQAILDNAVNSNNQIYAINVATKDGALIESYGTGVTAETRLLGWSMTKTFNTVLFGILDEMGKIDLDEEIALEEWKTKDRDITLRQLLQMNTGIDWEENYFKVSDATKMLFFSDDVTSVPAGLGMEAEEGTFWEYSSGTSNLLSRVLKNELNKEYHSFVIDELFDRTDMHSATIETDAAGHYIMSSWGWATARDWTRFGLLFLNDGIWNQDTIVQKDYLEFAVEDPHVSKGEYGAHIWLNQGGAYASLPKDAYYADGFGNQRVMVVPSKDLVITVLCGFAPGLDLDALFEQITSSM